MSEPEEEEMEDWWSKYPLIKTVSIPYGSGAMIPYEIREIDGEFYWVDLGRSESNGPYTTVEDAERGLPR
jgi:hypothetical protein